ncbi:hypothetical protein TVAG_403580 [Trichomonas vaginalis G3]|uniref:Kinase n=1 Tax=Trichomonas vaginalis (strain ATCC PRA-98 / G3) TaxID=412133 RepID=A2ELN6_TRIV3|nr:inositol phosphate biosynthetic process [Trichomonas vaginalis G3]EAY06401.1 hypothetical protein TVAG_403580 [Trichomonas vaginalis G3]KAI5502989.1 inositol phosphate biosynthetic process [Trichomonas vaginalis G3]|eukprot:XP_001318624.1 hypothetical protein [Trichomonas vaginalis G3]
MGELVDVSLFLDNSTIASLRGKVFGHDGSILTFKEGVIAKKSRPREFIFYRNKKSWINDLVKENIFPKVIGLAYIESQDGDNYRFKLDPTLLTNENEMLPWLMLEDLQKGYAKPAVLDVKLGTRTWEMGAANDKVLRHKMKCSQGTTGSLYFRVRAAMWYSPNPDDWPKDGDASLLKRDFGTTCTKEELMKFFSDFFHVKDLVPKFIDKIKKIIEGITILRQEADVRIYSSSALFVYDAEDPSKFDCRLLDFEKTYFNVEVSAKRFNESIEDCEDSVIPALEELVHCLNAL